MKKVICIFSFVFCLSSLYSQNKLILENCVDPGFFETELMNGPHTQGEDFKGCECYNRDDGTGFLMVNNEILVGFYTNDEGLSCENPIPPGGPGSTGTSIATLSLKVIGACSVSEFDSTTLLSGCSIILLPEPVPTLSQWSLVILGLLLLIFCIVALRSKVTSSVPI